MKNTQRLKNELKAYLLLNYGWDGYSGEVPSSSSVEECVEMVDKFTTLATIQPNPMLSADGEVSLYWDRENESGDRIHLELGFDGLGEYNYFFTKNLHGDPIGEDFVPVGEVPEELLKILREVK